MADDLQRESRTDSQSSPQIARHRHWKSDKRATPGYRLIFDQIVATNPHENKERSIITPPIAIEMGEESSENLEAIVKVKTGETMKADERWKHLPHGIHCIDTSVVGAFMFQTDAGDDCSIQMVENGKLPTKILISRDQDFSMFLVVVLRHEKWTTSGEFYLRFLRRAPVLDKRCLFRTIGPFDVHVPSSSDSELNGADGPQSPSPEPQSHPAEPRSPSAEPRSQLAKPRSQLAEPLPHLAEPRPHFIDATSTYDADGEHESGRPEGYASSTSGSSLEEETAPCLLNEGATPDDETGDSEISGQSMEGKHVPSV